MFASYEIILLLAKNYKEAQKLFYEALKTMSKPRQNNLKNIKYEVKKAK